MFETWAMQERSVCERKIIIGVAAEVCGLFALQCK